MSDVKIAALVAPVKAAPGLHYRNPRFPLNLKLPDNLECGTKIHIHGVVDSEPDRFSINLKNAEVDANIYFHFNPRFNEESVVRNSRLDESWGDEERDGENPFVPGQAFLITITPTVDCYEVEVNGNAFITYNHRDGMPLCDVTHIAIKGAVTLYGVHIPLSSMPIPLVLRIPQNLYFGDMILIKGEIPGGAERFHFNFQCGEKEDADIMYHFNPRFGEAISVANNKIADAWGDEVRDSLPVGPGEQISMCLVVSEQGFVPFINGTQLSTFEHRLDVSTACTAIFDGDIKIEDIVVDCPPIRLPPQVPDIEIPSFNEKVVQALHSHAEVTTIELKEPFGPGKAVFISGQVHDDPHRVEINLQSADGSTIALHVNPRFDEPDFVINSFEADAWGEEIREPNPISAGQHVSIYILCVDDGYCVLVDGDEVAHVEHRMDAGSVTSVTVSGSMTVDRLMSD